MAGSFFQNNSSILPSLLEYVATALRASNEIPAASAIIAVPVEEDSKRYLIDTYCGSGLFAIGLADQFDVIEGVEIDKSSVKWARQNATFNDGEGRGKVGFKDGKAEAIFDVRFSSRNYILDESDWLTRSSDATEHQVSRSSYYNSHRSSSKGVRRSLPFATSRV